MANLNNILLSCEKFFQSRNRAPAKLLCPAFTSSPKCPCFTGIQLSWKDRQAVRAVSPHVYCAVLHALPHHDLCHSLCISLPLNSVISRPHCKACSGCFDAHMEPLPFLHSSYHCMQWGKLWVGARYWSRVASGLKQMFWLNFSSIISQPFWGTKLVRQKGEHIWMHCSRFISQDLRV